MGLLFQYSKLLRSLKWAISAALKRAQFKGITHATKIFIGCADHFEPEVAEDFLSSKQTYFLDLPEREARLAVWLSENEKTMKQTHDALGRHFQRTFFYPAEHCHRSLLSMIGDHCKKGFGEIEVQLHHGNFNRTGKAEFVEKTIIEHCKILAELGHLSYQNADSQPKFCFVHGNWALANSGEPEHCNVNDELAILQRIGCIADFTYPSTPHVSQPSITNSIYQITAPLNQRRAHHTGKALRVGQSVTILPLAIQGMSALTFKKGRFGLPNLKIENSEWTYQNPLSLKRFYIWCSLQVGIIGKPEWIFIKLHAHGLRTKDSRTMFSQQTINFFNMINSIYPNQIYFTTAREMVNLVYAACEQKAGCIEDLLSYRYKLAR